MYLLSCMCEIEFFAHSVFVITTDFVADADASSSHLCLQSMSGQGYFKNPSGR